MNGNITKKRKLNRSPLDGDYDDDEKNRNRMKSAVGALEENHDENVSVIILRQIMVYCFRREC
jgi:hypothetical protein